MQTYLVGGAVRDELLGLAVKDRDWVVVGATPEDMLKQGFTQVGADFPVFLHPDTREEYALARTERKQGHGYHGFSVYSAPDVTLEQDLQRRDLTINAMARSDQGELIDPFNGRKDIERRSLRHVSEAFTEDPLRILRTARFAARFRPLEFRVCEQTMELMRAMVQQGEVEHLVPERVWQEIRRAFHEQEPGTFFEVLRECGALARLIPELDKARYFDAALKALRCMHRHGGTTEQRFAALLSPLPASDCKTRAQALKAPNDCQDLATLTTRFIPVLAESLPDLPAADTLLTLFDNADLWRRPERFAALLQVLACTLPEAAGKALQLLQQAADATTEVSARALMAEGFQGRELGQAIRRQRLTSIKQAISQTTAEDNP